MGLESNTGLGTLSTYGPRSTEGKFGAEIADDVVKSVVYDISWQDLNSTSAATYTGIDYVFPIGTTFLSCQYVVDEAIVGPTAITAGTYTFNTTTKAVTAHDADGLMTAAVGVVSGLDAVGDRILGTGDLLKTGTGAAFAVSAPVVVRILPTVAAATAGKMRVYITYLHPAP
jgi:hypothetical protein